MDKQQIITQASLDSLKAQLDELKAQITADIINCSN